MSNPLNEAYDKAVGETPDPKDTQKALERINPEVKKAWFDQYPTQLLLLRIVQLQNQGLVEAVQSAQDPTELGVVNMRRSLNQFNLAQTLLTYVETI